MARDGEGRAARKTPAVGHRLAGAAASRLQVAVRLCDGPGCRRFTLAHAWLRKDGIFLEGRWLCSPFCFQSAVAELLARPVAVAASRVPRLPRMPFRLTLFRDGVLSEVELKQALAHARVKGVSLGEALLVMQLVSEAQLAAARAIEAGCAFYTLPPNGVPKQWQLPELLAETARAVLVQATEERVMIGFVERIDRRLLSLVETMFESRVEACFITATHWEQQMTRNRSSVCSAPVRLAGELKAGSGCEPDTGDVRFTRPARWEYATQVMTEKKTAERAADRPAGKAAGEVLAFAVAGRAERVRLARMGSVLWVCLWDAAGRHEGRLVSLAEDARA